MLTVSLARAYGISIPFPFFYISLTILQLDSEGMWSLVPSRPSLTSLQIRPSQCYC